MSQKVLAGKKSQPINECTSQASLVTSLPVENGTEKWSPGGTVDRRSTTTGV